MSLFKRNLLVLALSLSLIGSLAFVTGGDGSSFEITKNLDIFASLYKEVNTYYVDDIEPGQFMRKGIDAMLASLDPYTDYYSESEIENYRFQTTGKYGGTGCSVRQQGDRLVVTEIYRGFAAYKAGLKVGDVLIALDGKSVKGKSVDDISKVMKGSPGTDLKITVERPGAKDPLDLLVKREEIAMKSVPFYGMLNDSVGYIKFVQFSEGCSKEVLNAFHELKKNPGFKKLVFDLRGNPGGLLTESVNIVNYFVDKGTMVIKTKGKVDDWNKTYNAVNDPVDLNMPIIVIVNKGSASASEITSGSLQDLDRAVILGQKSFGKGLVQTTRPLSYGTQVKITTAHYYTPSGRCIQALDYSHRNPDGSVGHVPDSLKTAFKTKNGRTVYDGGGVDPDVKTSDSTLAPVTIALLEKNILFDFCTQYVLNHPAPDTLTHLHLSEADWNDFVAFSQSKGFSYKTKTELALDKLKENAAKEKYDVQQEVAQIQNSLTTDKAQDLVNFKGEIMDQLYIELAARYFYQNGRIQSSLQNDNDLKAAVALFADMPQYNKILKGNQ